MVGTNDRISFPIAKPMSLFNFLWADIYPYVLGYLTSPIPSIGSFTTLFLPSQAFPQAAAFFLVSVHMQVNVFVIDACTFFSESSRICSGIHSIPSNASTSSQTAGSIRLQLGARIFFASPCACFGRHPLFPQFLFISRLIVERSLL